MSGGDDGGVFVALHGHGDEPDSAAAWAASVLDAAGHDVGRWTVVTPAAPIEPGGIRSWFPSGPRGADPAALADRFAMLDALLADHAATSGPTVLAGFSQGAAVALEAAARGLRVDVVVAIAGFLPDYDISDAFHSTPEAGALVLVAGSDDAVVPSFMSEDAAAYLGSLGAAVPAVVTVSAAHTVDAVVVEAAARHLAAALDDHNKEPRR